MTVTLDADRPARARKAVAFACDDGYAPWAALAASQIVQERLTRMLSELTQIQTLVMAMARKEEAGTLSGPQASLAKYTATRTARQVAMNARDLLGGNGILLDHHVARHFADFEAVYTYEGSRTVQSLLVGRAVTGTSAFR